MMSSWSPNKASLSASPSAALRSSSRTSGGVRGIRLEEGDKLVSMYVVIPDAYLLVVTVNGYGKLTPISEYKTQSRGGMGIKTLKVTDKTGKVAAAKLVNQNQQLMLISKDGMVISTPVKMKTAAVFASSAAIPRVSAS